jgi:hypothetical protein
LKRTRNTSLWRSLGLGRDSAPAGATGRASDDRREGNDRRAGDGHAGERRAEDRRPPESLRERLARDERPRAHPRQVRRPGERLHPPPSPLRDISRRRGAQTSMEFTAGVASGAGLFLALAGAVFVFFPQAWPQPAAVTRAALGLASAQPTAPQPTAPQPSAPQPSAPQPSASQPAAVAPSTRQVVEAQPRTAAGRADAMPMTGVLAAPPPMPSPVLQTAAPATPPPAPPPQDEPPAIEQVALAGAHAIYLSSFPDRELAESGWQILERRYAKALNGLKPQVIEGRANGKRVWRLFAGPLGSAAEAAQRCRALAFGSVNCKPADFTRGDAGTSAGWEG